MRSLVAIAALLLLTITSCKPEDPGPSMRHELLTNGKWRLWHFTSVTNYKDPNPDTIDIYKDVLPVCSKDDYQEFLTGGEIRMYSGSSKCLTEPDDAIISQKWKFLNADTDLELKDTTETLHYDITMLNDTTLRLRKYDSTDNIYSYLDAYYSNIK